MTSIVKFESNWKKKAESDFDLEIDFVCVEKKNTSWLTSPYWKLIIRPIIGYIKYKIFFFDSYCNDNLKWVLDFNSIFSFIFFFGGVTKCRARIRELPHADRNCNRNEPNWIKKSTKNFVWEPAPRIYSSECLLLFNFFNFLLLEQKKKKKKGNFLLHFTSIFCLSVSISILGAIFSSIQIDQIEQKTTISLVLISSVSLNSFPPQFSYYNSEIIKNHFAKFIDE